MGSQPHVQQAPAQSALPAYGENAVSYTHLTHAAGQPHLGRSALDACELMNVGVNYLREHMIQEARIHYAYRDAGGGAPNVVQDHAALYYFIRSPKISQALELRERCLLYTSRCV